jgi:hypothetical protein
VDPHAVLGIDLSASDAELVRAFRRLALIHHPDRNGGSAESATRFREIKAAYDTLRARRSSGSPAPAKPAPKTDFEGHTNVRDLDSAAIGRVRKRLDTLDAAIRSALEAPSPQRFATVVDVARWARLDVDTALAMKGHVPNLRDERWARMTYTTRQSALDTLQEFLSQPIARLDLVGMRNLRARLSGVIAVARGASAAT